MIERDAPLWRPFEQDHRHPRPHVRHPVRNIAKAGIGQQTDGPFHEVQTAAISSQSFYDRGSWHLGIFTGGMRMKVPTLAADRMQRRQARRQSPAGLEQRAGFQGAKFHFVTTVFAEDNG